MTILPFVSRSTLALHARLQALLSRPIVLSPAERADYVRLNRFVAVTIRGDDLRLRVGLSTPQFSDEQPPIRKVPALSLVTLIDECRDCEDPVALSMLVLRCMHEDKGAHLRDAIALARRWTEMEPDNHLAWLVLATVSWQAREPEQAISTIMRGASASRWREHEAAFARGAVAAIAGPYFTPRQRLCAIGMVQGLLLQRTADSTVGFLHDASRDRTLRPLIVEMLAAQWRDADSPRALSWAGIAAAGAGLDDASIATRTQRADAYRWANHLRSTVGLPEPRSNAECDVAFDSIAHVYEVGERQAFMETLAAAGLDEAEAARLYVASLDTHGLACRAHLMTPSPLAEAPMREPLLPWSGS